MDPEAPVVEVLVNYVTDQGLKSRVLLVGTPTSAGIGNNGDVPESQKGAKARRTPTKRE